MDTQSRVAPVPVLSARLFPFFGLTIRTWLATVYLRDQPAKCQKIRRILAAHRTAAPNFATVDLSWLPEARREWWKMTSIAGFPVLAVTAFTAWSGAPLALTASLAASSMLLTYGIATFLLGAFPTKKRFEAQARANRADLEITKAIIDYDERVSS